MEAQMMHQGVITKRRAHSFFPVWVRQRELRQRLPLGHSDTFYKSLYSSISPCHSWGGEESLAFGHGLFSLAFSPDGTFLVAGCENKSFKMFDPLSRRLIHTFRNAHADIVTHVNFLNSRTFATGGVDRKVSLWDARNLKSRCVSMMGHSDKIANVEFSRKNEFLITSGLGGIIYIWDTKNWKRRWKFNTFMSHFLVHLRLNPDETKMIISTANGSFLIVHDLDFDTIAHDLDEFILEMFDFESLLPANTTSGWHSSRFLLPKRRRNRVEIVEDFINAGDLNEFSALEIHPQGRSVFSRRKNQKRGDQWTYVHDIEDKMTSKHAASRWGSGYECSPFLLQDDARRTNQNWLTNINEAPESGSESSDSLTDSWPDPFYFRVPKLPRPKQSFAPFKRRVHVSWPRMSHYIEEPYVSKWYIESLGVSADGRLLCSPFDRGIRLLAFPPDCSEQHVSWCGTYPSRLQELSTYTCHSGSVLCTKFSPRHCLLVSGSLDGKLAWYQPVV